MARDFEAEHGGVARHRNGARPNRRNVVRRLRCRRRCLIAGDKVRVNVTLTQVRTQTVLWAASHRVTAEALFAGEDEFVPEVVLHTALCIAETEMRRVRTLSLRSLEPYSVYLAGTSMLNRLAGQDFNRARELLAHAGELVPRSAAPHAMVAKWHVMRLTQGWSKDRPAESASARAHARRALQLDPQHAYALAVDGLVAVQTGQDFALAKDRYEEAILADPQEAYAWAARSGLHCYCDEPQQALHAANRAVSLSPVDPALFMFEAYRAMALLATGQHGESIEAAQRSLKQNRVLSGTYRILAIAQVLAGQAEEARATVQRLLVIEPSQTLRTYRERYPGRDSAHMSDYVAALREAGVPE